MAEEIVAEVAPRLTPPLPWHAAAVAQLSAAWASRHLPHALLMHGAAGLGKRQLAAWLAASVLCDRGTQVLGSCGDCASCRLIAAGSHADLLWVLLEEGKLQLSVDQIRAVSERLSKTSYRQGYKIAIIDPAHQMSVPAANALLKTLEEPPANTLLVLLSSQPSLLPPTVASRCQRIAIVRPTRPAALQWLREQQVSADAALLEFTAGAPLRALAYAGPQFSSLDQQMQAALAALLRGEADITQLAGEWAKQSLPERLLWLDLWLTALARAALTRSAEQLTFPARPAHLPSLPPTANISSVYALVDRARSLKAQLARTALQRELAIESWLLGLLELFGAHSSQ
jgi:DNA polymerase III subunit delta'